jgi:uncharacterized protein (DUF885 family)
MQQTRPWSCETGIFDRRRVSVILTSVCVALAFNTAARAQSSRTATQIANEYVKLRTAYDPTLALVAGLPAPQEMHLPDRSRRAVTSLQRREDALRAALKSLASADTVGSLFAVLREELEDRRALRICRPELWDLSHTEGWQIDFPALAAAEPVETPRERRRALALWHGLPGYLRTDIENLREGLALGYSVPKPVVTRVLKQIDGLLAAQPDQSPFLSPAVRARDTLFAAALRREVEVEITPAIRRYAEFLRGEYLPLARVSPGLSALPNGAACYRAYLRRYTTTDQSPEMIFDSGQELVSESTREIGAIGTRRYQTTNTPTIIDHARADTANRFVSPDQLIQFSRAVVRRSLDKSRAVFAQLPSQTVMVRPLPLYQRGSGVASHYQSNPKPREAATFWISTDDWANETRGAAEITAVHETIPGHHLQIATARGLQSTSGLGQIVLNAAYVEGWANYAERLAEEQGIDDDDFERIQRRVLAGRSLVIDPGIHAFGWSRGQAEAYAMETGMSREQADEVIDRVAVEPGQLTSYEVGGLAIYSLREAARHCFGPTFDVREFHRRVLDEGAVPLHVLAARIDDWIRVQCSQKATNGPRP